MRVALFGLYNQGNFGDDLMGVLFARFLTQAGFTVRIWGISPSDATDAGIHRCGDIDALLRDIDVLVLGGGGLFVHQPVAWPGLVAMYSDLGRLLDHCEERRIPVLGASLGGSGHQELPPWKQPAIRFIRQAAACSLRNAEEQPLMRLHGRGDFTCHPDVVWLTARLFPRPPRENRRPMIIVNLPQSPPGWIARRAQRLLGRVLARQREADVIYVDTSSAGPTGVFAPVKPAASAGPTFRQFARLKDDLDLLSRADLIITSRLHLGVAAMSYGAAMVSFFGRPKANLLLRGCGLHRHVVTASNCPAFLWRLASPARWRGTYRPPAARNEIGDGAAFHLKDLLKALDDRAAS